MSDLPLKGVTILDLSRLLPGPFATQMLADKGAEVIKVEEPELGDYARYMEPFVDGTGLIFSAVNRGKKAISLDLTAGEGREVLYELARDADVLVEGFSPGTVDRLEIDFKTLSTKNPSLVYCSLSGYGQSGPFRDRPGHDLNYAGYTGLLDMTRSDDESQPEIPGFPLADMAAGLTAAEEILAALLARELDNDCDRYRDVSIAESLLNFSQVVAAEALAGENPRPGETLLTGKYPCYGIYAARDGEYVTLSALEPKFWSRFCELVNREDLEEMHLSENRDERRELGRELRDLFKTKSRDEWENELGETAMVGSVLSPKEAVDHPHFRERGGIHPEACRVSLCSAPGSATDWPEKGEHNRPVLEKLGYEADRIDSMEEKGVI